MELATIQENALTVRNVNIRKADHSFRPIGEVAKELGIVNPAQIKKATADGGENREATADEKAAWKAFQKEYNETKEKGFRQNDMAAAVAAKEFQCKGFKVKTDKAGNVLGVDMQLRRANAKSLADQIKELREALAKERAEKATLLASKKDVQG